MRSEIPSETLTFLFTDIEGSTRLSQIHPHAMSMMLARHHAILRTAIESHHGHTFQIVGDSFCAAFHNALDALNAALDGQRNLRAEAWGETGPILVRMGLHTGMAKTTEDIMGMPYSGYATIASTAYHVRGAWRTNPALTSDARSSQRPPAFRRDAT
jgi:class 3 adenylate cyclase